MGDFHQALGAQGGGSTLFYPAVVMMKIVSTPVVAISPRRKLPLISWTMYWLCYTWRIQIINKTVAEMCSRLTSQIFIPRNTKHQIWDILGRLSPYIFLYLRVMIFESHTWHHCPRLRITQFYFVCVCVCGSLSIVKFSLQEDLLSLFYCVLSELCNEAFYSAGVC